MAWESPGTEEAVVGASQPITVFLIEHDAAVRDSLAASLQAAGLMVHVFDSASAFIRDFERAEPGCIVLDLDLPETDVHRLSRVFDEAPVGMPIVTTSGRLRLDTRRGWSLSGAPPLLQKPFGDMQLIEVILHAVRQNGSFA